MDNYEITNPYSQRAWWNAIQVLTSLSDRIESYERALSYIPGSYKLWFNYLKDLKEHLSRVNHPENYEVIDLLYTRALKYLNLFPKIWLDYCEFVGEQRYITKTRRLYDLALQQLPVSQHDLIWNSFIAWASTLELPETRRRIYLRYLQFNPSFKADYITFLQDAGYFQEATDLLKEEILNFPTTENYTKLAGIVSTHPNEIEDSEYVLLECLQHLPQDAKSWQTLAQLYVRRGDFTQARGAFQQGLDSVESLTDFGILFGGYVDFEEELINLLVETDAEREVIEEAIGTLEELLDSREMILSDAKLRQNPNDATAWLERANLFEEDPAQSLKILAQAVTLVDPMKAIGPYHQLWTSFAGIYEQNGDIQSARLVFFKASQSKFRLTEHIASVLIGWTEFELSHNFLENAYKIIRHFCTHTKRSLGQEVWNLYLDLSENIGDFAGIVEAYELAIDRSVATVQNFLNFTRSLISFKQFDRAFRVFEQGISRFGWPHVYDIWVTYLYHFTEKYKSSKLERSRDLFQQVIQASPTSKVFYLMYAKMEEEYGLINHAMIIYKQAVKNLRTEDKPGVFYLYMQRALDFFGISKMRFLFEESFRELQEPSQVIEFGILFVEIEIKLGELPRVRALLNYLTQFVDPNKEEHEQFREKLNEFEFLSKQQYV